MNENPLIACVGEVLWDVQGEERTPGGAPMNVAIHLARLGHRVAMISRVGRDAYGEELIRFMKEAGVDTSLMQIDPDLPTSEVLITLDDENNARYEIPHPVAWDRLQMDPEVSRLISGSDMIIFGTLGSRDAVARDSIQQVLQGAAVKMIDVNLRPPYTSEPVVRSLLRKADIAKLNEDELQIIAGWDHQPHSDERALMRWLTERYGLNSLVVTRGKEGAVTYSGSGFFSHPGYNVQVADTVGAGDAFLAGYISSVIEGAGYPESLDFACKTGAFVASRPGGTPDYTLEDIKKIDAAPG
jgi:fructokinase